MIGDTSPVEVTLFVDSAGGHVGAGGVDPEGGRSALAAECIGDWLESTNYGHMKVHGDDQQAVDHLWNAVRGHREVRRCKGT